jgi:hypothetical protein
MLVLIFAITLFIIAFIMAAKWYALRSRYFIYENFEDLKASNVYWWLCLTSSIVGVICFTIYIM